MLASWNTVEKRGQHLMPLWTASSSAPILAQWLEDCFILDFDQEFIADTRLNQRPKGAP